MTMRSLSCGKCSPYFPCISGSDFLRHLHSRVCNGRGYISLGQVSDFDMHTQSHRVHDCIPGYVADEYTYHSDR